RLSTVRSADEILVLNQGDIVERGTHVDLLKVKDGFYAKLLKLQIEER
ncbi:MAG: ABC-type transport system involved in Fe-S cluster assembly fused permease/ATPase subunit, partial [Chitinophagales bacterium]